MLRELYIQQLNTVLTLPDYRSGVRDLSLYEVRCKTITQTKLGTWVRGYHHVVYVPEAYSSCTDIDRCIVNYIYYVVIHILYTHL